jgi:hypothetical protein
MSPRTTKLNKGLHEECLIYLPDFNKTLYFLYRLSQKFPLSIFTEIRPEGAAVTRTDGRTDMTELTGVFRDDANAPKKFKL